MIAIDTVNFDFKVLKFGADTSVAPEDGAYVSGMYLEGCRWDGELGMLAESQPKVLYTKFPTIHLVPKVEKDIEMGHTYVCPVYKTLERKGTLSTTGHSTNFVMTIRLPMQRRHNENHWIKRGVALTTQLND